jgi:spermidine synthase
MAYLSWRGNVVAAVMLGRTGGAFDEHAVRRMEALLPGLAIARAAYGLPPLFEPLPVPFQDGILGRLSRRPRVLSRVSTASSTLMVRDRNGFREMVASHGGTELVWTRASIGRPEVSGWPYVELFHVAAAVATARRRALFVGCGGAVALLQFAKSYPGIAIDVVECDPAVIDLARAWYDLDSIPGLKVHVSDGATFIEKARPGSWDLVIVDAYDRQDLAAPFTRRSFFAALRRSLVPGGAAALNVIGTLDGRGTVAAVARAARAELDAVRLLPVVTVDEDYFPGTLRNVVVVGSRTQPSSGAR